MLAEYGAVSEQVAKAMAEGVCKTAGSTYGIGITGIAGPGVTAEKPVGLVYIGLTNGTKTWVKIRWNKTVERSRDYYRTLSASTCFKYAATLPTGVRPGRIILLYSEYRIRLNWRENTQKTEASLDSCCFTLERG